MAKKKATKKKPKIRQNKAAKRTSDDFPEDTNEIESLTVEQATALSRDESWLSLNGLTAISDDVAKALAQHEGGALSLDGLTAVTDEVGKALTQHKGNSLYLNGLTDITGVQAKQFARFNGGLGLSGLTTLSADAAKALAEHKDWLYLNGLASLSADVAKALSPHEGALELCGLTTLSADAAKELSRHKDGLYLKGLTTCGRRHAGGPAARGAARQHRDAGRRLDDGPSSPAARVPAHVPTGEPRMTYETCNCDRRGAGSLAAPADSLNRAASPALVRNLQARRRAMGLPPVPGAVGNPRIVERGRKPAGAMSWPRRPRSRAELCAAADRLVARLRRRLKADREDKLAALWRN